ncbi:beta-lactamase/transpeptidase-like protein [Auricularia subglabra TFB-10046 SS5]|nr:beta-lactamase/transpeptidase-like protein [Auricularia subglabra TFB-10046 SS5]
MVLKSPFEHYDLLESLPNDLICSTRTPTSFLRAPSSQALFTPEAEQFIRDTMALWDAQGLSIAVVRKRTDSDSWDVETRAFGVKDRKGTAFTTDTLVPIASNSKAFTAAAVGLLVANESISFDWTTKVHDIVPEFELKDPVASSRATLVDAFSHRTGLPRHDAVFRSDVEDPAGLSLRVVKYLRPSAEFREAWQYNNHMFNIGASIVSVYANTSFEDFVQRNLFKQAGFNLTTYDAHGAIAAGQLTEGFWRQGETLKDVGKKHSTWVDVGSHAGAGGILSNADDLAIWLQTLLSAGKSPKTGAQVIPPEILAKMSSGITVMPQAENIPELAPRTYGMGFMQSAYQGHQFIEHGGSLLAYRSQIIRFPNDNLGIAILTNEDSHGVYLYDAIKWRLTEDLLALPVRVDWNSRNKAANEESLKRAAEDEAGRLPTPPDAPLPDVTIDRLSATYSNPAYGKLPLRVTGDGIMRAWTENLGGVPSLLALKHFSGNRFNATVTSYTTPLGEDERVVLGFERFDAEFEIVDGVVKGFGVWGGLWGAGLGVPPPAGDGPRDKAEVWFDRDIWPWHEGEDGLVVQQPDSQRVLRVM